MAQKCEPTTQKALKLVGEALKLDSENEDKEAYLKYLESISVIVSTLYNDQRTSSDGCRCLSVEQKQKLINVARQCLDRIDVLSKKPAGVNNEISKDGEPKNGKHSESTYSTVPSVRVTSDVQPSLEIPDQRKTSLPPPLIAVPVEQNSGNSCVSPTGRLSVLQSIDWISPDELNDESCIQRKEESLSPLEKAYHDNKILIATYKKRSARAPNSYARINLSLELQRRMAENLQMARAQQEIYAQHLREKQERHLDEVTRKVLRGEELNSAEFQYRRELCAKIIEYEKSQNWIVNSKKQLSENPQNLDLVELIVQRILRDSNHPVTEELIKNSRNLCEKISSLLTLGSSSDDKATNHIHKAFPLPKSENHTITLEAEHSISPSIEITPSDDQALSTDTHLADEVKVDEGNETFEEMYAHNVTDVQQAIKSGSVLMSSLKSTIKKQRQVLKRNSFKVIGHLKLKDDYEEKDLNNANQMTKNENNKEMKPLKFDELAKRLESIAIEARDTVDFLVELVMTSYNQLELDENHEKCYLVIEDHLFSKVWPSLMQLCKLAFATEELQLQESMHRLTDCTPIMLGFDASVSNVEPSEEDYNNAVKLLKGVLDLRVPTKKLEVLVLVAKVLCEKHQRVDNNESSVPKLKPIGADDLIPLIGYACIQSRTPQLILECHLLEYLIHPKYLMGEAGYCLTSVQTALHYVQMYETKSPADEATPETTV